MSEHIEQTVAVCSQRLFTVLVETAEFATRMSLYNNCWSN